MKTLTHRLHLNVFQSDRHIPNDELSVNLHPERDWKTGAPIPGHGFLFEAEYAVASTSRKYGIESLTGVPGTLTGKVSVDWEQNELGEQVACGVRILYPVKFTVENICGREVSFTRHEQDLPLSVIEIMEKAIHDCIIACGEIGGIGAPA
jgi:hypothetical protein